MSMADAKRTKGVSPLRYSVVRTTECDYKALCELLAETLDDLHYNTRGCCACGWIAHESSAAWEKCEGCGEVFCDTCVVRARVDDNSYPLVCEECDPARENENDEDKPSLLSAPDGDPKQD
jgi:hypothetical protein